MRATAEVAGRVAASRGIVLDTVFAGGDFTVQVHQVCDAIRSAPPALIMAMPVDENAMRSVSEQSVQAGIGWFWLSRSVGNEGELRQRFPRLAISLVTPDQIESGRIQ